MVQVWHWHCECCDKGGVYDLALCLHWDIGMFQQWDKLVADIVGLRYPAFIFPVHSTIFCEYTVKILEL